MSRGCERCYAETMAARFSDPGMWGHGYAQRTAHGPRWTGKVDLVPEKLAEPLSWRSPRRCFVNSTSDMFHESLPFSDIAAVFGIMAATPHITFQILTKRPERAAEFYRWIVARAQEMEESPFGACQACAAVALPASAHWEPEPMFEGCGEIAWPLPNVWLGTSVEDQATADKRIPHLLACQAAVRFVSYEPALGPVDFRRLWRIDLPNGSGLGPDECSPAQRNPLLVGQPAIDWLIVGGESGREARPFDVAWARSAVEQCSASGVACFVKQLGARPVVADEETLEAWPPHVVRDVHRGGSIVKLRSSKGGDWVEWPENLRVRAFPEVGR